MYVEREGYEDFEEGTTMIDETDSDVVVIMRYPVLMEDEGRHHFIMGPLIRKEAEKWIKKQKDEYFMPSDYYIAKRV